MGGGGGGGGGKECLVSTFHAYVMVTHILSCCTKIMTNFSSPVERPNCRAIMICIVSVKAIFELK